MTALEKLTRLANQEKIDSHPNFPVKYMTLEKFRDNNTNELTRAVVAYLKHCGGFAVRINTMGVYRDGETLEKGLSYEVRTKGKFAPSGSVPGTPDILGTYKAMAIAVEIKFGRDKLSAEQEAWRQKWTAAGGLYFEARSFQQFFDEFNKIFGIVL